MIEEKVAIVTGASRGIGYAIARELAREGYALALFARSPKDRVKERIEEIEAEGNPVFYFSGDLSAAEDREVFVQEIMARYGHIDLLVNNAGVAPPERRDLLAMTEESFDFVLDINLKGTFFLTQLVANKMIELFNEFNSEREYRPVIINIGSISAYASSPERGEYCISKAGIGMLTKLFAHRLAEEGINVYELRPGIIYTDMTSTVKEKYDKLIREGITPIRRWGYPEDIANAVSVICSGKLNFSTGEVINVDGGFHLRRL